MPHKDATFHTLVDATELAEEMLTTSLADSLLIYTADHQVIPWCLITDQHDNALACRSISQTLTKILYDHPNTTASIRWIPGSAGFHPLKCILEVATAAATDANPNVPQAPHTITAIRQEAKANAIKDWGKVWLANPHWNPTYHTLQHPPSGQPPEFISRIESFAHPVFCTAIRLLTKHTFTGKYNTRHCLCTPDPHDCQCSQTLLQTSEHIITQCPLFNQACDVLLQPVNTDLSLPILFRMKAGSTALTKFIEMTQACIRPRRRPVEDHG
jgi:hypothetical protein